MYLRGSRLITWRVTVRHQFDAQQHIGLVCFMFGFLDIFNPRKVELAWDEGS